VGWPRTAPIARHELARRTALTVIGDRNAY